MQKIELTISPDYVPSWTIADAVRELFQNSLDQEAVHEDNKCSWSYEDDTLRISNRTSTLTASSLLLGSSTKVNDVRTIGQFGEGYKIAALVLLRNNKTVTVYNYGAREIWRPRFVNSRKFGGRVLTFFIEKIAAWDKVPDNSLTIEVGGITQQEFDEQILPTNLHLKPGYNVVTSTDIGDAIDLAGKIFVNGLYVCDSEELVFGYNFKPEHIKLDRDRKMVSTFEVRWLTSKLWDKSPDELQDTVIRMLQSGASDVAYLSDVSWTSSWRNTAYDSFRYAYGDLAVPVATQIEMSVVPEGYTGIIVPESYQKLIKSSANYNAPIRPFASTRDRLRDILATIRPKLTQAEAETIEDIIHDM